MSAPRGKYRRRSDRSARGLPLKFVRLVWWAVTRNPQAGVRRYAAALFYLCGRRVSTSDVAKALYCLRDEYGVISFQPGKTGRTLHVPFDAQRYE